MLSVMVLGEANTLESKEMFAEPALAAKSSASRRLQDASVPVPGVVWTVQFEAEPASSAAVVTTRFEMVTLIFPECATKAFVESVAVMVWLPVVTKVAETVPVPLVIGVAAGRIAWGSELVKVTVPP